MSDKPAFNFLEDTQDGGGTLSPSDNERILLKFALDQFGESLSRFLLSGFGEDKVVPRWLFTITFSGERSVCYSREVRVEADDRPDIAPSVPRHKEPLVALALLRLLIVDRKLASSILSYDQEEAIRMLGWEDTQESRLSIDEAVSRYFTLSYEWVLGEKELAEANLSFFHGSSRFISGYGHQPAEENGKVKPTMNNIEFNAEFVKGLVGRSLFGINWDSISSMERVGD
jgi:hypothetical protein